MRTVAFSVVHYVELAAIQARTVLYDRNQEGLGHCSDRCTGSLLVSAAPGRLDSNANNLVSIMHIKYYKFVPILSDIAVSRINDPLQFGWLWSVSCLCRR